MKNNCHYVFDYSNIPPKNDTEPTLEKITRLYGGLTQDNYLTHAIMLVQHKDLTDEQREYHKTMMKKLFAGDYERACEGYSVVLNKEEEPKNE